MNRVWKIIEERKKGSGSMSSYRGSMSSGRRGGMSGKKESSEYEEGVKDGLCAALDHIESLVHEMEEE